MQSNIIKRTEYFIINAFVFALMGLLCLLFNSRLFRPFTRPFRDVALTDLYYSTMLKKQVYNDSIIIVNIEHRSRHEMAGMIDSIQQYKPKVLALDIVFSQKEDTGSAYLWEVFRKYDNYVFSYKGAFARNEKEVISDPWLVQAKGGYVNMAGVDKEHSTVRFFYPYYNGQTAFTTAIMKAYDSSLTAQFNMAKDERWQIRYYGGDSAFKKIDYHTIMHGKLDSQLIKNHIVLFGYMGIEPGSGNKTQVYTIDEDRLFTPLNTQLTGRSYPDMYGVAVHANILRMMLDKDYTRVVPRWILWMIAFLLGWILVPVFTRWYIQKGMWFHPLTRLVQLLLGIVAVCISLLLYRYGNIKAEPAVFLITIFFIVDLILFYGAFVKFLRKRWGINVSSMF
jgi:CHASE2 domain-containing sensor protein